VRLKKLLKGITVKPAGRLPEADITSIATSSKDVKRGGLFVAIEGFMNDGHKFLEEAFRKGARAALVSKEAPAARGRRNIIPVADTRKALSAAAKNFYGSPSERLKVIGITGTNGKTTISLLIESIFKSAGIPCGVIGTIDYRFGKRAVPAARTTPDALRINELLDSMLKNGMKAAVMEVSSHALDQKRVDDIFFDAAIFTNLTHEHLDYHGTLKRYFASKAKIFSRLKKGGTAIINIDDARIKRLRRALKHKKITYGLGQEADVSADVKGMGLDGSTFLVKINGKGAFSVDTKLIGAHNISNILAASAAGLSRGIDPGAIKRGIEGVKSVRGRLESVDSAKGFRVFVDYAHTHNALERVLRFLNRINHGNIITVFGSGGERDKGKRPLMGRVAQKFSDFVVITNDNSRGEDPREIARGIISGMNKRKRNYVAILDRRKAIERALKKAGRGDIVLIAGKGHETELIVGDKTTAFDDRKVAEQILKRL
jgi:UDP-N-acetylmuramoyl-L-alanyl-D-glutamate--2,6-diaminopimelate ligase